MAQQQPSSPPPMTSFLDTPPPSPESPPSDDKFVCFNGHNFGLSDVPVRIMFYMNESWQDFKGKTLEFLCSFFANGLKMVPFQIKGVGYTIDFLRMIQVHHDSAMMRSIAWIDQQGKPFFPVQFFDADFKEMDQTGDDDDDNVKGKRKIHAEGGAPSNNGGGYSKQKILTPRFPNTKLLSETDKTYLYTKKLILSSIAKVDPDAIVIDIHEFQISGSHGRSWWNAFEKQIEITEAARGKANVIYALYAAPKKKVESILSHGFELLPHKHAPQAAGIFLADLRFPQQSAMQYPFEVARENEKHIILCRVVLGSVEKLELELLPTGPSREEFDTASNNPKNPVYYVVWGNDMNSRIFPVCVITCKTSAVRAAVYKRDFETENSVLPELMLGIKKGIPLANVPILDELYDCYKKGRTTKEKFADQLRDLAGMPLLCQIAEQMEKGEKVDDDSDNQMESP